MAYLVTITPSAEADMDRIIAWLVKQSPAGAQHWLTALEDAISVLEHSAEKFGPASEHAVFGPNAREHYFSTPKVEATAWSTS